ncbi:hypothetical protein, partial [Nocardia cyriacigeorgica]|uniref:hypothetical protein n=1 Tax=Nocardia cyriacigeorgica TaxID=135487 RepID=UPI0024560330
MTLSTATNTAVTAAHNAIRAARTLGGSGGTAPGRWAEKPRGAARVRGGGPGDGAAAPTAG